MTEWVSLGYNCGPATALKGHGLRLKSYPFDWILSDLSYVCFLIKTRFVDLFEHCIETPDGKGCTDIRIKSRCGMTFPHQNFFAEDQRSAMERRCHRFMELIGNHRLHISFVYYSNCESETLERLHVGLQDFQGVLPSLQCKHRLIVVRAENSIELHERNRDRLQDLAIYIPSAPSDYDDNTWRGNSLTWLYLFSLFK